MSDTVPDQPVLHDNMGITDAVMPLNGTVIDVNGLASRWPATCCWNNAAARATRSGCRPPGSWPSTPPRPRSPR